MVKIDAVGVCHSDLSGTNGTIALPLPLILGHEAAGHVIEIGEGVTDFAVGDHVVANWIYMCGRCHYCVIGRPNLCERRQPGRGVLPDGTTRMSLGGAPVYHYGHVATYASRTVVHESCAIRIDPAMPLDRAALIGCSVMTGVGAVLNTAAVPAGASVAVFGVGGVGLNVVQGGALVAAHPIIAVDLLPAKLEHARAVGASHLVDASREDPVAAIRAITRRGADFTFVAVGATRPITQAVDALAPGGTCVLIGVPESGAMVPMDVRPMVTGERVVRGSSYGSARTREDLPRMVALYRAGKLRIDELITHRYGLEDANEAFRALAAGELGRGIIVF